LSFFNFGLYLLLPFIFGLYLFLILISITGEGAGSKVRVPPFEETHEGAHLRNSFLKKKTRKPVCVAAPLQQQTYDTISELQKKSMVYQSYDSGKINTTLKYHRPLKLQQGNHNFSPYLSFIQQSSKWKCTDLSSGVDQSQTYGGTHQGAPRRKVSVLTALGVARCGRRQV